MYHLVASHYALAICLFSLLISFPSFIASGKDPETSPTASTELICHTLDPSECYPAVFIPTKEFQTIREDQSIPPGLHVRMNLATGLKEARLNIPEAVEDDINALVILEDFQGDNKEQSGPEPLLVQNEENIYHPFEPEAMSPEQHSIESNDEVQSIAAVASRILETSPKDHPEAIIADLDFLADLAHDAEWGLQIVQHETLLLRLLQIIDPNTSRYEPRVRSASAIALGSALQNNNQALDAWRYHTRAFPRTMSVVGGALRGLVQDIDDRSGSEEHFTYARRLMFLLAQVCHDSDQLSQFAEQGGLITLINMYNIAVDPLDIGTMTKLKVKIANFAIDFAPALAMKVKATESLRSMCVLFESDASVRYITDTIEYQSRAAAHATLRDVMGGQC